MWHLEYSTVMEEEEEEGLEEVVDKSFVIINILCLTLFYGIKNGNF